MWNNFLQEDRLPRPLLLLLLGLMDAFCTGFVAGKLIRTAGLITSDMALKLDQCHRWLALKKYLKDHHGISVHFSSLHYNYYSAWKYVTKEDEHVLQSDKHPELWNSKEPKTSRTCSERKKIRCEQEAAVTSRESIESGDCNIVPKKQLQ